MVDKKPVKRRTPADKVTPIRPPKADKPAKEAKPRKPRQVAMGGMPAPVYEFEGVGYGKFRLAVGGLGNIKIDAPISADGHGKRIRFSVEADLVSVKHNRTKGIRMDIGNADAETFKVLSIEDLPEDYIPANDDGEE